jgi:hypothetical protein
MLVLDVVYYYFVDGHHFWGKDESAAAENYER